MNLRPNIFLLIFILLSGFVALPLSAAPPPGGNFDDPAAEGAPGPAETAETAEDDEDDDDDEEAPLPGGQSSAEDDDDEEDDDDIPDVPSMKGSAKKEERSLYDFDKRFGVLKDRPKFEWYWSLNLLQEFHYSNNSDLREVNEESDLEIKYTDDQIGLGVTRAKIDTLFYFPDQRTGLEMSWGFDGIWGHDQLQGFSNPGTRIGRANAFWAAVDNRAWNFSVITGRQYFSIGGLPEDYMQKDILDAVVLDTTLKRLFNFRVLAIDFFSGANNFGPGDDQRWNDEFQFLTRDENEIMAGLNGDVSTYRWGGVLSFEEATKGLKLLDRLDPRLYGFYARVRGDGGGSDRSENGRLGNFSDNDWSAMYGGRVALDFLKETGFYADLALSTGKDIRRQEEPEADMSGMGLGAGVRGRFEMGKSFAVYGLAGIFTADGAEYDSDGNIINHGFVSFKGDEVGGLLLRRYWGVHPSAYVDDDGIDNKPFDANRKAGLFSLHLRLGFEFLKAWELVADFWHLQDRAATALNFNNLNSINNPFKSRAELEAQERLGSTLGQEINVTLRYKPNKLLSFFLTPAIFLPGDFYKQPLEESVSGNGPPKGAGQDANFVGLAFGSEMRF